MAINQLIAAGIQPPRFESPYNMMAQFAQIQQAQQANALNQMRMQQMEREMAQEEALRGLDYAALAQSPEMALRYGAPGRALFGEVLKGQRELRQAKLAEAQALPELIKGLRFSLAPVNSQESYDAWRNTAAKTIPALAGSLPETFSQDTKLSLSLEADKLYERVIQELGLGGTKEVLAVPKYGEGAPTTLATRAVTPEPRTPEQIELDKARTARAVAATDVSRAELAGTLPARPGAQTELTRLMAERDKLPPDDPNRAAYDARIEALGKGGGTTVNVGGQEGALNKKLGEVKASTIEKGFTAAEDAVSIIDTIGVGRQILNAGATTGFGANFLVNVGQALKQVGVDLNSDASANAQTYMANMAQNVGRVIKLFGAGTGLSNADREYAEKMAGGNITLDERALRRILDINERMSRNVIKRHNDNVKRFNAGDEFLIQEPSAAQSTLPPRYQEAQKWLDENPTDPRAEAVRRLIQGQR